MKFFVLCLVVLVAGAFAGELTEAQKERLNQIMVKCIKETGTSEAVVHEMRAGNWAHVDNKAECYTRCALTEGNYLVNDKPNLEALKQTLVYLYGEKIALPAIQKCKDVTGPTPCASAFNIYKCFYDNGITGKIR